MKTLLFVVLTVCLQQYATAGCGMDITTPTHIEGNYTYDSVSNTYYIHPGDTMFYAHGLHAGGTEAWNLCLRNDSVFANNYRVVITDTGTYAFSGGCSGFEMQTGNFRVAYYAPTAILETEKEAVCYAYYSTSAQVVVINYSNMYRERITYSLYNLSGQQILHGGFTPINGGDQQYTIDLSGSISGSGMYIMVMETIGNRYTSKMIYTE